MILHGLIQYLVRILTNHVSYELLLPILRLLIFDLVLLFRLQRHLQIVLHVIDFKLLFKGTHLARNLLRFQVLGLRDKRRRFSQILLFFLFKPLLLVIFLNLYLCLLLLAYRFANFGFKSGAGHILGQSGIFKSLFRFLRLGLHVQG